MWNLCGVAKVACMLQTWGEHDGTFDILEYIASLLRRQAVFEVDSSSDMI